MIFTANGQIICLVFKTGSGSNFGCTDSLFANPINFTSFPTPTISSVQLMLLESSNSSNSNFVCLVYRDQNSLSRGCVLIENYNGGPVVYQRELFAKFTSSKSFEASMYKDKLCFLFDDGTNTIKLECFNSVSPLSVLLMTLRAGVGEIHKKMAISADETRVLS